MSKILILGGTKEAAVLAQELVDQGHDVTTSLAGRTKEPKPVAGEMRVGGFGGAEGLAAYLTKNQFTKLIDATHPFALQISKNAVEAARLANVRLDVRTRKPWKKQTGDEWIEVEDLPAAAAAIPTEAKVLLALGSQHLSAFSSRTDVHFVVRMVDQPESAPDLKRHTLILGKPSLDWREEAELLQSEGITHIVCRNSGGAGAYAKIEAARELDLPVIVVSRLNNCT